jgi:hypothetical protein
MNFWSVARLGMSTCRIETLQAVRHNYLTGASVMAQKGRGMVRQPATKFAQLRKKMDKVQTVAKAARKKR